MGIVISFIVGAVVGITLMCIAVILVDDEEDERK